MKNPAILSSFFLGCALLGWLPAAIAQADHSSHKEQPRTPADPQSQETQSMQHDHMHTESSTFIDTLLHRESSGTSVEPNSIQVPMLMTMKSNWMLMLHGQYFLSAIEQSGPRGADKVFSTNWSMFMAQRQWGPGQLTLRAMVSLEPATVTGRYYPQLFQPGETAFGRPLNDGQHPHDFFMELAALYDVKLGENALLSFYAAPVGDPAMGPTAYPHRASASEDPAAPLGHHLQDSTHIASDVVTVGLAYKLFRIEASGFHGREPDEFRWDIDSGKIDSWSTRLTVQPKQNWSAQYSFAHLTSPEALHPAEDIARMTASVMYNRNFQNGSWTTTLLWGRNHSLRDGGNSNGYLAESTLRFLTRNRVWGRAENLDRTNELLLGRQLEPPGFQETFLARIQAYTAGYDREINVIPRLSTAVGWQVMFYGKPAFLTPIYGQHPAGVILFVRIGLAQQGGH